jgi:hypothetical protein
VANLLLAVNMADFALFTLIAAGCLLLLLDATDFSLFILIMVRFSLFTLIAARFSLFTFTTVSLLVLRLISTKVFEFDSSVSCCKDRVAHSGFPTDAVETDVAQQGVPELNKGRSLWVCYLMNNKWAQVQNTRLSNLVSYQVAYFLLLFKCVILLLNNFH